MNISDTSRVIRIPLGQGGRDFQNPLNKIPPGMYSSFTNSHLYQNKLIMGGQLFKHDVYTWQTADLATNNSLLLGPILDILTLPDLNYYNTDNTAIRYLFSARQSYRLKDSNSLCLTRTYTTGLVTTTNGSPTITIVGDHTATLDDGQLIKIGVDDETYRMTNVVLNGSDTDVTLHTNYTGSSGSSKTYIAYLLKTESNASSYATVNKGSPLLFTDASNDSYVIFFGYGCTPEKQYIGNTNPFELLGGTPPDAFHAMILNDHILAAKTLTRANDIFWTTYLDPEGWDISGSQYYSIGNNCDEIIAMKSLQKDVGCIFTPSSIYSISFVGGNTYWEVKKQADIPIHSGPSVAVDSSLGVAFYLSRRGIYVFDGYNNILIKDLDPDNLMPFIKDNIGTQVFGYCLPLKSEYVLKAYSTTDASCYVFVYNYKTKQTKLLQGYYKNCHAFGEGYRYDDYQDAGSSKELMGYTVGKSYYPTSGSSYQNTVYFNCIDLNIKTYETDPVTGASAIVSGIFHPGENEKERRMKFKIKKVTITYDGYTRNTDASRQLYLTLYTHLNGTVTTTSNYLTLSYSASTIILEVSQNYNIIADKVKYQISNSPSACTREVYLTDIIFEYELMESDQ